MPRSTIAKLKTTQFNHLCPSPFLLLPRPSFPLPQTMLDQIIAAFDRRDYKTVAQLLKEFRRQSPDSPWVKLYAGRLQEVAGNMATAEAAYRELLRETVIPKVALQARQGLQRLEEVEQAKRQQAVLEANHDPLNSVMGFLVLEVVSSEKKQQAAQKFAQVMKLDAYTARLLLPSRGWRLYRVGAIGELQMYGQALRAAEIPVFWVSLPAVQRIRLFRVQYFQSASPQPSVVCLNESDQMGAIGFDWSEVTNRVEGRLPIFEDVVDTDVRNRLTRKEQTQDYAQVYDLHLPQRNCILRFGDWSYQFQQGIVFDASQDGESIAQTTNRLNWNRLIGFLDDRLAQVPVWSDFMPFAESALDPLALTGDFQSHIDLFRKAPSRWDVAFQLYSSLVFEQGR